MSVALKKVSSGLDMGNGYVKLCLQDSGGHMHEHMIRADTVVTWQHDRLIREINQE